MYCGQCGKRVLDTMLFCPFCGAPIVIPDQDAPEEVVPEESARAVREAAPVPRETEPTPEDVKPNPAQEEPSEDVTEEKNAPDADTKSPWSRSADLPGEEQSDLQPAGDEAWRPSPEEDRSDSAEDDEPFEPLRLDEFPPEPEEPKEKQEARSSGERPRSLFDDPLDNGDADSPPKPGAGEAELPKVAQRNGTSEARIPRSPAKPVRSEAKHSARSYIPVRDVDVNDMFMDGDHREEEDFDPYDGDGGFEDDFDFEERERGGFFQRHIRGLVGLVLTMMLLVILLIWAVLPRGQRTLATMNLAWKANVYDDLGHEAYNAGMYEQAATYFERALARDGDNYEYAHSAMVAHYDAGDDDAALNMLKRCIEMNPDSPEPYHELLTIFPDPATRPWDVNELIRLGYERTGDETLKPSGE